MSFPGQRLLTPSHSKPLAPGCIRLGWPLILQLAAPLRTPHTHNPASLLTIPCVVPALPTNLPPSLFPALQQERQGHIDTELATVISSISLACKQIAAAVGRSGISSLTGVAGTGENVQVGGSAAVLAHAAPYVCLETACLFAQQPLWAIAWQHSATKSCAHRRSNVRHPLWANGDVSVCLSMCRVRSRRSLT